MRNNQATKYGSITKVNYLHDFLGKEIFYDKSPGLRCEIKNSDFTFDNEGFNMLGKKYQRILKNRQKCSLVKFNWLVKYNKKASASLTKNLTCLLL